MFEINVFSFSHGTYNFNGKNWYQNKIITRYPPREGTAEVKKNGEVMFRGDTKYLLGTIHKIPGLEKIFPDRMW